MITDCHIHLRQICDLDDSTVDYVVGNDYSALVSCHCLEDLQFASKIRDKKGSGNGKICISYGVHPFCLDDNGLKLLDNLIRDGKVDAVGEIGLDKYSYEQKQSFEQQKIFFETQLEMAIEYKLPVILHIRKSMPEIFTYSKQLAKLKSVIFHSYSGTAVEAQYILEHGINAFFSFGTALFNGHLKAVNAVLAISLKNLLVETDAPYQPIKGEKWTKAKDIELILLKISEIKKIDLSTVKQIMTSNFVKMLTKD